MSFVKRIEKRNKSTLYFVGSHTGLKHYAYVLVPAEKADGFEQAVSEGKTKYQAFGAIIDFALGTSEPPKTLKQEVAQFVELMK